MSAVAIVKTRKFGVLSPGGASQTTVPVVGANSDKKTNSAVKLVGGAFATSSATTCAVDSEQLILSTLAARGDIPDSWNLASEYGLDHQVIVGAIKSLLVDSYVIDDQISTSFWTLTDEGSEIIANGSPEMQVYTTIPAEGINVIDLQSKLGDVAKIGLGPCMKNKWLKKQGDMILKLVDNVKDETSEQLASLASNSSTLTEEDLKNLKRRKLVQQVNRKSYKISKGPDFQERRTRKMADLTKDMLGNKTEVRVQ